MVHLDAGELPDRPDRERGAADLRGGVDLRGAEPGDLDAGGRAGSRGTRCRPRRGSVRTSIIESERRAPWRSWTVREWSVPSSSTTVGLPSSEPSSGASAARSSGSSRAFASCTPLRTARKLADAPDDEEQDEDEHAQADAASPRDAAGRSRLLRAERRARGRPAAVLPRAALRRRQRRDLALRASAAVDAVGLVLGRHAGRYGSRGLMADPLVIGVDLGGTKIAAGLVDGNGGVRERRERTTPTESQEALLDALEEAVAELLGADVAAVGIGVPSHHRPGDGPRPRLGQHPARRRRPRRAARSARFGLPVAIENDANAAAFAEWRFGAGQGCELDGHAHARHGGRRRRGVRRTAHARARRVRAHRHRARRPPCQGTCTGRGHLEAYVSGTAATAAARVGLRPGGGRVPARPARATRATRGRSRSSARSASGSAPASARW